jgi:glycosyltransferase involved in cell wall biosynthesis
MFGLFKKKKVEKVARKSKDLKVSVIMPIFLGEYEGCAKDREKKFERAVISFTVQNYKNKELIIISDGCDIAEEIYNKSLVYKDVHFYKIEKQPLFSGNVRNEGIKKATGDIICYLDSDDALGITHLQTIANAFERENELDWVYYNDLLLPPYQNASVRDVNVFEGSIGTSSIAHWRTLPYGNWKDCDGYGHDWVFIKRMLEHNPNYKKIMGAEYYVCHLPNIFDN